MPRYSVAIACAAPAGGAPFASILAGARPVRIRELGFFSNTATAALVGIYRPNNTPVGTSGVLGQPLDPADPASTVTIYSTWSTPPTIGANVVIRKYAFPATIGAGVIQPWQEPLLIPASGFLTIWNDSGGAGPGMSFSAEWDE